MCPPNPFRCVLDKQPIWIWFYEECLGKNIFRKQAVAMRKLKEAENEKNKNDENDDGEGIYYILICVPNNNRLKLLVEKFGH